MSETEEGRESRERRRLERRNKSQMILRMIPFVLLAIVVLLLWYWQSRKILQQNMALKTVCSLENISLGTSVNWTGKDSLRKLARMKVKADARDPLYVLKVQAGRRLKHIEEGEEWAKERLEKEIDQLEQISRGDADLGDVELTGEYADYSRISTDWVLQDWLRSLQLADEVADGVDSAVTELKVATGGVLSGVGSRVNNEGAEEAFETYKRREGFSIKYYPTDRFLYDWQVLVSGLGRDIVVNVPKGVSKKEKEAALLALGTVSTLQVQTSRVHQEKMGIKEGFDGYFKYLMADGKKVSRFALHNAVPIVEKTQTEKIKRGRAQYGKHLPLRHIEAEELARTEVGEARQSILDCATLLP